MLFPSRIYHKPSFFTLYHRTGTLLGTRARTTQLDSIGACISLARRSIFAVALISLARRSIFAVAVISLAGRLIFAVAVISLAGRSIFDLRCRS